MDIRAFLASSKSSESSQTSTASTSKRAIDDSSTSQSSSKRKFVGSWLKDFKWLTYDLEGNPMFCKVCRDNPTYSESSSTFVSGSCCLQLKAKATKRSNVCSSTVGFLVVVELIVNITNKHDCVQ